MTKGASSSTQNERTKHQEIWWERWKREPKQIGREEIKHNGKKMKKERKKEILMSFKHTSTFKENNEKREDSLKSEWK